ncbi:dihydroorotate dehydrogenase (quinone) [Terasakiella brassicae]|uniref:Dihydroorotate dehydrogenase (Quinone) n=2 Tax=Terasakiella brassicae TaxID=1634917 RepID=A0A917C2F4_9PROT|nr:dihydroorotate dehydrogenase (quinone) [Terasakiella brassicae]
MARKRAQRFECDDPLAVFPKTVMGIDFANPLGLAAGFDKLGTMTALARNLGLGFMEVGSLMQEKPLSFSKSGPLGMNIAADVDCMSLDESLVHYTKLAASYAAQADFLVINLSSPRSRPFLQKGGRGWTIDLFQQLHALVSCPICLKVRCEQIPDWIGDLSLNGVVVAHIAQEDVQDIKHIYADLCPFKIVSVGGVMTQRDVEMRLSSGADLVEIFSLLVLKGPKAVRELVQGLWP